MESGSADQRTDAGGSYRDVGTLNANPPDSLDPWLLEPPPIEFDEPSGSRVRLMVGTIASICLAIACSQLVGDKPTNSTPITPVVVIPTTTTGPLLVVDPNQYVTKADFEQRLKQLLNETVQKNEPVVIQAAPLVPAVVIAPPVPVIPPLAPVATVAPIPIIRRNTPAARSLEIGLKPYSGRAAQALKASPEQLPRKPKY